MADKSKRSRSWIFVINNYTFQDIHGLLSNMDADYFIFGFEEGTGGTPHIQGYAQWKSGTKRLSELKKMLPRAHFEVAVGNFEQNYMYCKGYHKGKLKAETENEYYEFGEAPCQGKRTDLMDIKEDLDNYGLKYVSENHFLPFLRYGKMMTQYVSLNKFEDRREPPIVEWVYGGTGTGKTRYAFSKSSSVYMKDYTKWWDGYEQQEVIIIDDFDRLWPFRDLLRLLDRYPYQGQIKGGYVKINSKYIIITCDRSIEELYRGYLTPNEIAQLKRRICREFEIKNNIHIDYKNAPKTELCDKDSKKEESEESEKEEDFFEKVNNIRTRR